MGLPADNLQSSSAHAIHPPSASYLEPVRTVFQYPGPLVQPMNVYVVSFSFLFHIAYSHHLKHGPTCWNLTFSLGPLSRASRKGLEVRK